MKKLLFFIILGLLLVSVTGCKEKSKVNPTYIAAENIYEVELDRYFIYFEKENCSQCAAALPSVIEYLTETHVKKNGYKIYAVLLEYTDENGETVTLPISRAFTGADTGQGPNGNFYVDGVSNWVALYIAAAPSLIEVTRTDGVAKSKLVAVGTSEIEKYLKTLSNE